MRRALPWIGVIVVVLGAAYAVRWAVADRSEWIVRATMTSSDAADDACGDLPGIDQGQKSFSATSDIPPPAEGVYWTVRGRDNADAVAECLTDMGATEVGVDEPKPPQDFSETGP